MNIKYDVDYFVSCGYFGFDIFNGDVSIKHVIEIIPEKKSIIRFITDDDGMFIIDGEEIKTETVNVNSLKLINHDGSHLLPEIWW